MQVPEALEKELGWRFNERGLVVGSLSGRITRADENHFCEKRR